MTSQLSALALTRPSDTRSTARDETFGERFAPAPCTKADPDLGFPAHGARGLERDATIAAAKTLCESCPLDLKAECLQIALDAEGSAPASSRYGVFGGLDEAERASLTRRMSRAKCGTTAGYRKHLYEGADPCDPCRLAYAESRRAARAAA